MTVLDASAVLAFLFGERGANKVESALVAGAVMGAANWSEVAQKFHAHQRDWSSARALLESYDIMIEPVTIDDAETAAALWSDQGELSLADRLCIALSRRLNSIALTADRAWGTSGKIRQIR